MNLIILILFTGYAYVLLSQEVEELWKDVRNP